MTKKKKLRLGSYEDIFSTEESRKESKLEHVQEIPISELHDFKNHPFRVVDDESMKKTVESVEKFGVIVPAIARPRPDGGYELICGHRRKRASELAGLKKMPVIVRDLDDDEATILMVDSNLQRETILPSEKAQAYKMKLEALKHQGERADLTSCQVGTKLRSDEKVAESTPESARTVQRYIRLTNLIDPLLEMVDEKKIALNPAVELSYLSKEEQKDLLDAMDYGQSTPSLSQAQRMKKLSQDGKCTPEAMCAVMSEEKKQDVDRIVLKEDVLRKYFPKSYTPHQMEETILHLLDQWQKKRSREEVL